MSSICLTRWVGQEGSGRTEGWGIYRGEQRECLGIHNSPRIGVLTILDDLSCVYWSTGCYGLSAPPPPRLLCSVPQCSIKHIQLTSDRFLATWRVPGLLVRDKVGSSAHVAESGAYVWLGLFCSLSWLPKQGAG